MRTKFTPCYVLLHRKIAFAILCSVLVVSGSIRLSAWPQPGCGHPEVSTNLSPDGAHAAYLAYQLCDLGFGSAGNSYSVSVGARANAPGKATDVFTTWNFAPQVSWLDARTLVITLHHVSDIGLSLHQAGNVKIVYRIDKNLSKDALRKSIPMLNPPSPSVEGSAGNSEKSSRVTQILREQRRLAILRLEEEYDRFNNWVQENVDE